MPEPQPPMGPANQASDQELLEQAARLQAQLDAMGDDQEPEDPDKPADSVTPQTTEQKPKKRWFGKEKAPAKTPAERIKDTIDNLKLEPLLPEKFKELSEEKKLKVVEDLKRRVVDIVKSDAETQYSEDLKKRVAQTAGAAGNKIIKFFKETPGNIKRAVVDAATKERDLKNLEHEFFEKLKTTPETQELLRKDLELLVNNIADERVKVGIDAESGKARVDYVNLDDLGNNPGAVAIETVGKFNTAANALAQMPYEWGQEKGGKHKKEYDKAKAAYDRAKEELLAIKQRREGKDEKGKALLEMLSVDNALQMEQLLNTHPEVEKALDSFAEGAGGAETAKTVRSFLNTVTGKNMINRALIAGGIGARMLTKFVPLLLKTGAKVASASTLIGGMGVGAVIGGIRGKIRGKETLRERQQQARHGQEDESKERVVMSDVTQLTRALEKLIAKVENPEAKDAVEEVPVGLTEEQEKALAEGKTIEDLQKEEDELAAKESREPKKISLFKIEKKEVSAEENKARALSMLVARIEHTQKKIESGQVNFGDAKSTLINQFNFINTLNKAWALKETLAEGNDKELGKRIDTLLAKTRTELGGKVSEAQKKFVKAQMIKGAALGAGLAGVGYGVRYLFEHFGWFGAEGPGSDGKPAIDKSVGAPDDDTGFFDRAQNWIVRMTNKITGHADADNPNADSTLKRLHDANVARMKPPEPETTPLPKPTRTLADVMKDAPGVKAPSVPSPQELGPLNPDAIIGKGEGIEHAFRRQIENNPELAQALGYKGDLEDAKALRNFSGGAAHRLARDYGYVDKTTGEEVWIKGDGGDVAYEAKIGTDGKPVVYERLSDGTLQEMRTAGGKFEVAEDKLEDYEYQHGKFVPQEAKSPSVDTADTMPELREEIREHLDSAIKPSISESSPGTEGAVSEMASSGAEMASTPAESITTPAEETWRTQAAPPGEYASGHVKAHEAVVNAYGTPPPADPNNTEAFVNGYGGGSRGGIEFVGNPRAPYYGFGNPYRYDPGLRAYLRFYGDVSQEDNDFINHEQEFARHSLGFEGRQVLAAIRAREEDLGDLFPSGGERSVGWSNFKDESASGLMRSANSGLDTDGGRIATYLKLLKQHSGLKPKPGILGFGEKTREYMARALMKLAKEGKLKAFQGQYDVVFKK